MQSSGYDWSYTSSSYAECTARYASVPLTKKNQYFCILYEWGPQDTLIGTSNFATKFEIVCIVEFYLTQCLKTYVIINNKDIIRSNRKISNNDFLSNHGDLEIFFD